MLLPEFLEEMAHRLAEWSVYYRQLAFWNRFVEESVLRERLPEEEKPAFDLSVIDTEIDDLYEKLQEHGEAVGQKQTRIYEGIVDRIATNDKEYVEYEEWLREREEATLDFAKTWGRRYDGREIQVGKTTFLIKDAESSAFDARPGRRANVVEVTKERVLTPLDLLNRDGTVKEGVE